jgi:FkbM family methyltransferase
LDNATRSPGPRKPDYDAICANLNASKQLCSLRDFGAAYRVLTGNNITPETLRHFDRVRRAHKWDLFTGMAVLAALDESQRRLNLPESARAGGHTEIQSRFGYKLYGFPADLFVARCIKLGAFEPDLEAIIQHFVRPGDVALDVGANIGYFTGLMATRVGPSGRVIAFEAIPSIARLLEKAKDVNAWNNTTVIDRAASNQKGRLTFKVNFVNPGGCCAVTDPNYLRHLEDNFPELLENTEVTTIDAEVPDLPRCDFVKIDTEGHEAFVFEGMAELLRKHRPRIVFEFTPANVRSGGKDPVLMLQHLMDMGYQLEFESYVAKHLSSGPEVYLSRKWSAEAMTQLVEAGVQLANVYAEPPSTRT